MSGIVKRIHICSARREQAAMFCNVAGIPPVRVNWVEDEHDLRGRSGDLVFILLDCFPDHPRYEQIFDVLDQGQFQMIPVSLEKLIKGTGS